jgi:hypothetical protein
VAPPTVTPERVCLQATCRGDADGPEGKMGAMALGPGDGYNAGAKVSVQELLAKDAEDESLRRYKEQLLGAAAKVL